MGSKHSAKIFVLDTNVILHDSECISMFADNDLVIPMSVLEELDRFKKGSDTINHHAREFIRKMDELYADGMFNGGVSMGEGLGRLSVKLDGKVHPDLVDSLSTSKVDNSIINVAYKIKKDDDSRDVSVISKDVNLRMKAKSVGLSADDYTADQVKDLAVVYTGSRTIEDVDKAIIDRIYSDENGVDPGQISGAETMIANEYAMIRSGKSSVLAILDHETHRIRRVEKVQAYGVTPRNVGQTFALDALLDPRIQLVTISGKAGTGKTLLALAAALEKRRNYRQVFMARPVVPLSNKDLGYLPGDIHSKLDPYMQPLYDNLGVIKMSNENRTKQVERMLEDDKLVVSPLAYIRGRSLVKVYFIVDEAQNLTPHEVKTIITRAGEGTKVILTGDVFQIDHPYLNSRSNGLSYVIEKMKEQEIYAHVNLDRGERSRLAEIASDVL